MIVIVLLIVTVMLAKYYWIYRVQKYHRDGKRKVCKIILK